MSEKRQKRKIIKKKLFSKNRIVIQNEDTFEEIFSLRLTLMNVLVLATLGAVIIIFVTTFIIAFTPLREYIPGYASTKLKKQATDLAIKSDSMVKVAKENELYIESVKKILRGEVESTKFNKDSILAHTPEKIEENLLQPSEEEIKLRESVAREDKYNLLEKAKPKVATVFFPPVKGSLTEKFNISKKHYAVDVALPKNTAVKSILTGRVIFADWTPTTGNVIIVLHTNEFISVYKHLASLTVSQGDAVSTGEVIGIAGSTGQESTGIHLHFELWKNGYPVDPTIFINFN